MDEIKNIAEEEKNVLDIDKTSQESQEIAAHKFPPRSTKNIFKGKAVAILLIFAGVFTLAVIIPGIFVYAAAKGVVRSAGDLYAAFQAQDLTGMKTSLEATKGKISAFDSRLNLISLMKFTPFVRGYYNDAKALADAATAAMEAAEIGLDAAEPYADLLGLNGAREQTDGAKTAEDRIDFIVESVEDITAKLDPLGEKTNIVASQLEKIKPERYPENFRGIELKKRLKEAITLALQVDNAVSGGKPVLEQLPYLIGKGEPRRYLFLWQNDKELRPTGGFITAYSIVEVKDGKFKPVTSDDIYNLDRKFNSRIPAPEPVKNYLAQQYWHLRDMNLSPDFKVSMQTFSAHYKKTRAPEFDGIVAMDTKLVVDLLDVIGRIGVPGYGNFSAENDSRCNCPVVIYELESYADVAGPIIWDDISGKIILKPPHHDNRKAILGPLMNSIIANAMGQPKEKLPDLFQAGWKALLEKHVMFYFADEEIQAAMEAFGLAGRVKKYEGDYLHINDSNMAGAKSNLYVEQEVKLDVKSQKEGTQNTLSIKYSNPQKWDGWLNGPFRNWVRLYVPKGSTLIEWSGSEEEVKTYEELEKTVFEGFFTLRPEGVIELTFKYKTPVSKKDAYSLLIQKQPGTEGHLYTVEVNGEKEEFRLKTDKELRF